jgi:hypothetical protein
VATIRDFIRTALGVPIAGATVRLRDAVSTGPAGTIQATTTTNADGMFEFTGLAGGPYDVEATLPGSSEVLWWKGLAAIPHSFNDLQIEALSDIAATKINEGTVNPAVNPATVPTNLEERLSQLAATLLQHSSGSNWYDPPGLRENALVNPSHEIWQRGTAFDTDVADGYTSDGWQAVHGGLTRVQVAKDTSTVETGGGEASAQITVSGYTADSFFFQRIENPKHFRSRQVVFAMRVKTNVANKLRLQVATDTEVGTSAYHSGSGNWELLTATVLLTGPTVIDCYVRLEGNLVAHVDQAVFCVGKSATFTPMHPADDLARCQRYYELHGNTNSVGQMAAHGVATAASQTFSRWVQYHVQKGGLPTLTKNGTWVANNCTQPATANGTLNGYSMYADSSAAGAMSFYTNGLDDTVTSEWNV